MKTILFECIPIIPILLKNHLIEEVNEPMNHQRKMEPFESMNEAKTYLKQSDEI